ncbi:MAG: FMN-binding protein [Kineosporiaceae bacterium]|nr:FMN-binding protein [Kineosporiaceae bacterium]
MRRPAVATMSTISGLVLVFSYHAGRAESSAALEPGTAGAVQDQAPAAQDLAPAPEPTAGTTEEDDLDQGSSGGSAASRTYLGDAVNTHFGPVQVQITVAGGRITAAEVTQVPMSNGHDVRINSQAVPILNAAAVAQQSAEIDGVSGATITSGAYRQSLQSAIDAAGL